MSELRNSALPLASQRQQMHDRATFTAQTPNGGIPRRVPQSTLALQLGFSPREVGLYTPNIGNGRDAGTQILDYSTLTPPFDYQAYLQRTRAPERTHRPQFRSKVVCLLSCKHCEVEVCKRGMKAILLADMNVELYSTDAPPYGVQLVADDYETRNCNCRIRDVACLGCGVQLPLTQMFHCAEVSSVDRINPKDPAASALLWSSIPRADKDALTEGSKEPVHR